MRCTDTVDNSETAKNTLLFFYYYAALFADLSTVIRGPRPDTVGQLGEAVSLCWPSGNPAVHAVPAAVKLLQWPCFNIP